jgi:hypothetical protein
MISGGLKKILWSSISPLSNGTSNLYGMLMRFQRTGLSLFLFINKTLKGLGFCGCFQTDLDFALYFLGVGWIPDLDENSRLGF